VDCHALLGAAPGASDAAVDQDAPTQAVDEPARDRDAVLVAGRRAHGGGLGVEETPVDGEVGIAHR